MSWFSFSFRATVLWIFVIELIACFYVSYRCLCGILVKSVEFGPKVLVTSFTYLVLSKCFLISSSHVEVLANVFLFSKLKIYTLTPSILKQRGTTFWSSEAKLEQSRTFMSLQGMAPSAHGYAVAHRASAQNSRVLCVDAFGPLYTGEKSKTNYKLFSYDMSNFCLTRHLLYIGLDPQVLLLSSHCWFHLFCILFVPLIAPLSSSVEMSFSSPHLLYRTLSFHLYFFPSCRKIAPSSRFPLLGFILKSIFTANVTESCWFLCFRTGLSKKF